MLTEHFRDDILINPIESGANSLKIVTALATHNMASWHLKEISEKFSNQLIHPIEITLLIGMCVQDGLRSSIHEGFKQLINDNMGAHDCSLKVQYVYRCVPVHSNLYLWENGHEPFCAFVGSADYTQSAFLSHRRELMVKCIDAIELEEARRYFNNIEADSIYCNDSEIEDYVRILPERSIVKHAGGTDEDDTSNVRQVTLSFLTKTGETGKRSGINWGQRDKREPNQAYLRLPAHIAKTEFFPLNKQHFTVITDDGKQLILRVEQQGDKAITTPSNNSLLGEYFRNRLGLANGAYVTADDLKKYGRSDVTFYKIDDEQFFMDFSV